MKIEGKVWYLDAVPPFVNPDGLSTVYPEPIWSIRRRLLKQYPVRDDFLKALSKIGQRVQAAELDLPDTLL